MKIRSPFLALVKMKFVRSSTVAGNPCAWAVPVILLGVNVTPALILWLDPQRTSVLVTLDVWAVMILLSSLVLLSVEGPIALVRGMWGLLPASAVPAYNWDEFVSSRAIDRALHFRAKTTMLGLVLVLPQVINLGLVCLVTRQFPPGTTVMLDQWAVDLHFVSNADAIAAFAYSEIWASSAAIVFAQGHFAFVSKCVARGNIFINALAVGLPTLLFVLATPWVRGHLEIFSIAASIITAHWLVLTLTLLALAVPVQRFCERSFAEQEVL